MLLFLEGPTANNATWLWEAVQELRTLAEQL
jgi:hypothetical protein